MLKSDWLLLTGWRFWLFLSGRVWKKAKPRCKDRRWLRKLWLTAVQYLTLIKPVYQYLARFFSSCSISFSSFCKQLSQLKNSPSPVKYVPSLPSKLNVAYICKSLTHDDDATLYIKLRLRNPSYIPPYFTNNTTFIWKFLNFLLFEYSKKC